MFIRVFNFNFNLSARLFSLSPNSLYVLGRVRNLMKSQAFETESILCENEPNLNE